MRSSLLQVDFQLQFKLIYIYFYTFAIFIGCNLIALLFFFAFVANVGYSCPSSHEMYFFCIQISFYLQIFILLTSAFVRSDWSVYWYSNLLVCWLANKLQDGNKNVWKIKIKSKFAKIKLFYGQLHFVVGKQLQLPNVQGKSKGSRSGKKLLYWFAWTIGNVLVYECGRAGGWLADCWNIL